MGHTFQSLEFDDGAPDRLSFVFRTGDLDRTLADMMIMSS